MEEENATVSQETEVEQTTTPSASETQTTSETEMSEETTIESPGNEEAPAEEAEEKKPRAEARISQLNKKLKEAEARADYWEKLNAKPVERKPVEGGDDGYLTADQVAEAVDQRVEKRELERVQAEAKRQLEADVLVTLEKHPELETNDKLAKAVWAYARENNLRLPDAATEFMGLIAEKQKKTEQRTIASQAGKVGVSTPSGTKVNSGEERVDIDKMTPEEKAANWNKILQTYSAN